MLHPPDAIGSFVSLVGKGSSMATGRQAAWAGERPWAVGTRGTFTLAGCVSLTK